jgi:hypothetical protein
MNELDRVLAAIRAAPAATTMEALARHLGVARDDLDAMVGYWVHRGAVVIEEVPWCASAGCSGCALAGTACGPRPRNGAAPGTGWWLRCAVDPPPA